MTTFRAQLRRMHGWRPRDYLWDVLCSGEDLKVAMLEVASQHPGYLCKDIHCIHMGLLADTQAQADVWRSEILNNCDDLSLVHESSYGQINIHALGLDNCESVTQILDEIHVLNLSGIADGLHDRFLSKAKIINFHHYDGGSFTRNLDVRHFNWSSVTQTCSFIAHEIQALERPFLGTGWHEYIQWLPAGGVCHVLEVENDDLIVALDELSAKIAALSHSSTHRAFLLFRYGLEMTLGDLMEIHTRLQRLLNADFELPIAGQLIDGQSNYCMKIIISWACVLTPK